MEDKFATNLLQALSGTCEVSGCKGARTVSCPHGHYCLSHAREHGESDEACDKAIDCALAVVIVDGVRPLVGALKALREIDAAGIEREIFPIKVSYLGIVNSLSEFHDHVIGILQAKLDSFTVGLRERFEGNPMPYGLTDDEAWEWYKRHVSDDDAEH